MTCNHAPEQCAVQYLLLGRRCCDGCIHRPSAEFDGCDEWPVPEELFLN